MVTTARIGNPDLDAVVRLRGRYGSVVLVVFDRTDRTDRSGGRGPKLPPKPLPAVGPVVRVTADQSFPAVWDQIVGTLVGAGTGARR